MLISKFDLYEAGWLDLVFENRNKEYGAYELRQHYAKTMTAAMLFTFFGVSLLFGGYFAFRTTPHFAHFTEVAIDPNVIHVIQPPPPPVKRVQPPPPSHLDHIQPPAQPVNTVRDVVMVVTTDNLAQKPVKNDDLTNATISTETNKGKGDGGDVLPTSGDGQGTTPAPPDNTIYNTGGVDVMPTPVGGEGAWSKFLNKNLRFPYAAQADGVSGRVFVSFVIEKDGSLSNFVLERPAGHGFDEEALRVLKLAKAWKPGLQNGQPVRVKYVIPINFQLAEEN